VLLEIVEDFFGSP